METSECAATRLWRGHQIYSQSEERCKGLTVIAAVSFSDRQREAVELEPAARQDAPQAFGISLCQIWPEDSSASCGK